MTKAVFVTTIGGMNEEECLNEYGFLFGSLDYHAEMGSRVIVDTTMPSARRMPNKLPSNVEWVYEPIYGHGMDKFRYIDSMNRALDLADRHNADIVIYLDCDEYFARESVDELYPKAISNMLNVQTWEWRIDGKAYSFNSYHRRLWPANKGIRMICNAGWKTHKDFDGNAQRHMLAQIHPKYPLIKAEGIYHHHIGRCVGRKMDIRKIYAGIPRTHDPAATSSPWPELIRRWKETSINPATTLSSACPG